MSTLMIIAIVIVLLILTMLFTLILLFRVVKAVRELRLDLELDRAAHQQWVDQFLLLSSRVRTLGEESAEWAGLVENHFAYLDSIEVNRRLRKELPKPLTPFSLRKQGSEQPELSKDG